MFGHDDNKDKKDTQSKAGKVIEPIGDSSLTTAPSDATTVSNGPPTEPVGPPPPNDFTMASANEPPADLNTAPPPSDNTANGPAPGSDELLSIKQQALQQLQPLVSHLDQNPEEKFKTTMMMIQATDDQSMLKTAFEAAKQIKDDKSRAQALLDVINEINYFTQNNDQ